MSNSTFTHKHYVQIADVLRRYCDSPDTLIREFANIFADDNKRFDRDRFIDACSGEFHTNRDKVA